jgi:hypothetical protein
MSDHCLYINAKFPTTFFDGKTTFDILCQDENVVINPYVMSYGECKRVSLNDWRMNRELEFVHGDEILFNNNEVNVSYVLYSIDEHEKDVSLGATLDAPNGKNFTFSEFVSQLMNCILDDYENELPASASNGMDCFDYELQFVLNQCGCKVIVEPI